MHREIEADDYYCGSIYTIDIIYSSIYSSPQPADNTQMVKFSQCFKLVWVKREDIYMSINQPISINHIIYSSFL